MPKLVNPFYNDHGLLEYEIVADEPEIPFCDMIPWSQEDRDAYIYHDIVPEWYTFRVPPEKRSSESM